MSRVTIVINDGKEVEMECHAEHLLPRGYTAAEVEVMLREREEQLYADLSVDKQVANALRRLLDERAKERAAAQAKIAAASKPG